VWTGGKKASKGESNIGRKEGGIEGAGDAGQKGGCHGGKDAGDRGGKDPNNETLTAGDKAAFGIGASCGGAHKASKESIREGARIGGGGVGGPFIKPSSAKPSCTETEASPNTVIGCRVSVWPMELVQSPNVGISSACGSSSASMSTS